MRIPSGVTDQYIYFVAVDSTDLKTRETGLSSFTVYRSRNGGTATAYTSPTVAELSAANMPGVYSLLLDEDMTIDSGDDTQEICLHITQASMAPVTRVIELYRPKITAGNTLGVASDGDVSGNVDGNVVGSVASVTGGINTGAGVITTLDGLDTAQDTQHATTQGFIDTEVAAILEDTGTTIPALIAALNDLDGTAVGDAVLDEVVEGTWTMRQLLRLYSSVLLGKIADAATTTNTFRDIDDSKARVTATVDTGGNRSAVVLDAT